jgi:hypothetical protein
MGQIGGKENDPGCTGTGQPELCRYVQTGMAQTLIGGVLNSR